MRALLRRLLPARPTTTEITQAWLAAQRPPRATPDLEATHYIGSWGDPGSDPIGSNRWASPLDLYPWVKTGYDRWIHLGGWAVRSDRQVRTYLPGTMRQHRPPHQPWPR